MDLGNIRYFVLKSGHSLTTPTAGLVMCLSFGVSTDYLRHKSCTILIQGLSKSTTSSSANLAAGRPTWIGTPGFIHIHAIWRKQAKYMFVFQLFYTNTARYFSRIPLHRCEPVSLARCIAYCVATNWLGSSQDAASPVTSSLHTCRHSKVRSRCLQTNKRTPVNLKLAGNWWVKKVW